MTTLDISTKLDGSIFTQAAHAGPGPDPVTGAVVPPIHQTTTYAQEAVGVDKGFTYSRVANPTVVALEQALCELEDAAHCSCYSSGIAAVTALALATLKHGDHVVLSETIYGGTVRLFNRVLSRFGIDATYVDTTSIEETRRAVGANTKLVLIETPANPTLALTDIAALAEVCKEKEVIFAVDNTFLTPVLQRPIDFGADVVVYSTTKHIEGHNTTVGGAILTNDNALHEQILEVRKSTGAIQTPLGAWTTLLGLKTLPLRLERHCRGAQRLAEWLAFHPRVRRVNYPFLDSFPQRELAQRQQRLGGGILSFVVDGGDAACRAIARSLKRCYLAENLGALETLITHSASMTHADVPPEHRERIGVDDGLLRVSVGLEDPDDIIADIEQAFEQAEREGVFA